MTKPDETYIFRMAEMIRAEPGLGDEKTAARRVGKQAGYQAKALKTFIERLRRKYRRLRVAGKLPAKAPIPTDMKLALERNYIDGPKREAANRDRKADLEKQLQVHGLQVPESREERAEHLKALAAELDRMQVEMPTLSYELCDKHDSLEDAEAAAQAFVERKEWLEMVVPLYRELRYL